MKFTIQNHTPMNQLSKEDRAKVAESNKLIAEFMGIPYEDGYWLFNKDTAPAHSSYRWSFLCYHEEWNWLMPVVERITTIRDFEVLGHVKQERDRWGKGVECCIYNYNWKVFYYQPSGELMEYVKEENYTEDPDPCRVPCNSFIEAYYLAIIHFITWYNQNNQCIP